MQRASPPGANQQQQMLTRVMPLLFGFWGFFFPAGLVLYWTTANLIQIGQQRLLLRAAHIDEGAAALPAPKKKPARKGLFASMMERAEQQRSSREGGSFRPNQKGTGKPSGAKPSSGKKPAGGSPKGGTRPNSKGRSTGSNAPKATGPGPAPDGNAEQADGNAEQVDGNKPADGNQPGNATSPEGSSGGNGARDRKKRRKR
jgi:YidC/Oxa1 family membrane protein insertase